MLSLVLELSTVTTLLNWAIFLAACVTVMLPHKLLRNGFAAVSVRDFCYNY